MDAEELPELKLDRANFPAVPKPVFMTLASSIVGHTNDHVEVPYLARAFEATASQCEERMVKRALLESAADLDSRIAHITRRRIEKMLPPVMRTLSIENAIIKVGSYAAQVPELWDLVYPK